jgi:hypothetical protein
MNQFQQGERSQAESNSQFDADAKIETSAPKKVFSSDEIEDFMISNALQLFLAGFDTSSNGMSLTR